MRSVTVTGKTIEEATKDALNQIGTVQENVEIEVLEEPKKGFLGFGGKPARIKVTKKLDIMEQTSTFLQEVISNMGVEASIEGRREDRDLYFTLSGEKIAILIGKRGQTLNSLQYLTNLAANRFSDRFVRVVLDAENYRERREETLKKLADRLADKAMVTKRDIQLEPMPSLERKVIHLYLKDKKGISTHSDGNDPHRRVVIVPRNK
ncbi:RNA-binding cell elongation regulator Jag/EloR [Alkalihalobacillus macyae]|uniref:RNA-binding cell elongation regulator Jag/EloR n=1 Tax=Guptibacillus hwajinpoensis TaxID=208199 RepID=UPI00273C9970|nr:RNA-binding cell elongation regulator Jag/EloR [Alkalihalobacillus macyae]MDP4552977.1 RNA-binding cell elongation regulator Jag/EloR [Alkalihalobacillus macyae]